VREAVLRPGARATYLMLDEGERDAVDHRLALIEHDPSVDHRVKFEFPRPPLMLRLFDDGEWRILYYLPDQATVAIQAISHVLDP
jgi:hypothetical protein